MSRLRSHLCATLGGGPSRRIQAPPQTPNHHSQGPGLIYSTASEGFLRHLASPVMGCKDPGTLTCMWVASGCGHVRPWGLQFCSHVVPMSLAMNLTLGSQAPSFHSDGPHACAPPCVWSARLQLRGALQGSREGENFPLSPSLVLMAGPIITKLTHRLTEEKLFNTCT